MSSHWRQPDQAVHPYYFGDSFSKKTCLWLKNLPKLYHNDKPNLFDQTVTHVDKGKFVTLKSGKKMAEWYSNAKKENRGKIRSKTFIGIAKAMAKQWGGLLTI